MAAWRRAIELSLGEADTAKLRSIAQSRTEPASRVRGTVGAAHEQAVQDGEEHRALFFAVLFLCLGTERDRAKA